MKIVSQPEKIGKLLSESILEFYYSQPWLRKAAAMASSLLAGTPYLDDAAGHSSSAMSRWLASGWDLEPLSGFVAEASLDAALSECISAGDPFIVSIDDTTIAKTEPRESSIKPMEGAGWHWDNNKGETVYGYKVQAATVGTTGRACAYAANVYKKDEDTKIGTALEIISSLPAFPCDEAYIMTDSWYTCEELMAASMQKGYTLIGAAKISWNGTVPSGAGSAGASEALNLLEIAMRGGRSCWQLVRKGKKSYLIRKFVCVLSSGREVAVVASWPEKLFGQGKKYARVYVSTDTRLSAAEIFRLYRGRWRIERFFDEAKNGLGVGKFLVRPLGAIERLLLLACLAHYVAVCGDGVLESFEGGQALHKFLIAQGTVRFVIECLENGMGEFEIALLLCPARAIIEWG